MTNWMLDIETLGTGHTPRPLSIAFVRFDLTNGPTFSYHFHIDQTTTPGTVDADTALWWMRQDEAARTAILEGQKGAVSFGQVANALSIIRKEDDRLWARGIDWFWMENLYKAWGGPWPFKASQVRCMRFCDQICPAPAATVKHDALADCLAQIDHLRRAVALVPGLEVVCA
jgi:hypothetical protein